MNNKLNEIYTAYAEELNKFAENYADGLSPQVRNDFQNLLYSQYNKEVKSILNSQTFVLKTKNKLYKRFLSASRRLNFHTKAENWYETKMKEYLGNGILLDVLAEMLDFLSEENPTLFQCLLTPYVCTDDEETSESGPEIAEPDAETEESAVKVEENVPKQDTATTDKPESKTEGVENVPKEETKPDVQTDSPEANAEAEANGGAETDKSASTAEEKPKPDYWKNRRKKRK